MCNQRNFQWDQSISVVFWTVVWLQVRKQEFWQMEPWESFRQIHGHTDWTVLYFPFLKNCPGLIPDLKKIGCTCLWCSCLLMILIFWVAEEFNYCKVCKSSLIFSYVFALQFRKDLFIKNVPPEFQKEKSNGLSVKVCKMHCDWDVCVSDSSIQCQDHSTTHCYGKDEGNIPSGCQLPDWL